MHNIETRKGQASFFSVKEKPWHGLGTILPERATSEEALIYGGLDYKVKTVPTMARLDKVTHVFNGEKYYHESSLVELPDSQASFRPDTRDIFGTVGKRYTVIQNQEAFDFIDSFIGTSKAVYETGGVLGKGETMFVSAKMPDHIMIKGKDQIDEYFVITNSHDGSGSLTFLYTPIRVVCNNTLNAALETSQCKYSVKHTKNYKTKIEQVAQILERTKYQKRIFIDIMEFLQRKEVKDKNVKQVISRVLIPDNEIYNPLKAAGFDLEFKIEGKAALSTQLQNKIAEVNNYYFTGPGQDGIAAGNLYGIYNAFTGYNQNVKPYSNADKKFSDMFGGTSYDSSLKALNTLNKIAQQI